MGAMPLPLPQSQIPGSVPTNSTPTSTIAPVAALPGLVPMGTTQNNPFAAPSATTPVGGGSHIILPGSTGIGNSGGTGVAPLTPGGSVPTTSTTQTPGINWNDGSNTVTGDFKDTYGAGTGTAISDVLQGLGTSTDTAVQATVANTERLADQQYGNIQAQEAASGITPNSSTAALAAGDFYSGVNSSLQESIGNMELNEENTLLSTLTNEGSAHGTDPSTFDSILNGIGDAGEIAGAVAPLFIG